MTELARYLKILGIEEERPSLDFLRRLVRRHSQEVPYENVSKLLRFPDHGPSIPSLPEFISGIERRRYGGTCFTQNVNLNKLLNLLGFESKLVAVRREGELSHVSIRTKAEGRYYFIDAGIMSEVAGPFLLNPGAGFDLWCGRQKFIFTPRDEQNYSLELFRDGKLIRNFWSAPGEVMAAELDEAVRKTFKPEALFMGALAIHLVFESHSAGIWNKNFYKVKGDKQETRTLHDRAELIETVRSELRLPNYEMERALASLPDLF